jgi:SAM-dependent methyltransferase
MIIESHSKLCPICGNSAFLKYSGHPGYKEPDLYDIYYCSTCDTSFADPLVVDNRIYEDIYNNLGQVPGYTRYAQYASNVLLHKEPLNYLAESEDMYWGVAKFLNESFLKTERCKILEVGSGLGYLTYSLAKKGFDITGLDISQMAVNKAIARYGDYFVCGDLRDIHKETNVKYDIIIMTELIEHVTGVVELFDAADALLSKGGKIIITTPNKSAYSMEALWDNDLPPVHLWWFSETSIRFIASHLGYSVKFTDFTEFNKKNYQKSVSGKRASKPTRYPLLNINGKPVIRDRGILCSIKQVFHNLKFVAIIRRLQLVLGMFAVGTQERRATICAILSKEQ